MKSFDDIANWKYGSIIVVCCDGFKMEVWNRISSKQH